MESNPPSRFLREIDPGFLNQPIPDVFGSGTEEQDGRSSWSRRGNFGSHGGSYAKNHGSTPAERPGVQGFKAEGTVGRDGRTTPQSISSREDFQAADVSSLTVGMDIEHDRFGRGRILSLEGEMPNTRAVIEFEFGGAKTLLLKFARLRKL